MRSGKSNEHAAPRARETHGEWRTCALSRILQRVLADNSVIAMTGENGIVKVRMPKASPGADLAGPR
jgi:hypothetical protein